MRAFALVTARELRAYAPAWMAALATALLPWLAPLLPAVGHQPASEVRVATAAALAALLGLAFATFAGAGLLARDLAEGRMGFFLALPLPAWAVWGGRVLAAVLLVYGSVALVVVPPALAAGDFNLRALTLAGWPGALAFAPLASLGTALLVLTPFMLILLAHQLALALRSRSPWLLADFGGLVLASGIFGAALGRLFVSAAVLEFGIAVAGGFALGLLALVLGGGFGLARGGVLLARVHRAQAVAAGAGLLAASLAVAGFARWVVAVDAGDLTRVWQVAPAPTGPWVTVVGSLRHRPSYTPWMLIDTAGGTSLRLSPGLPGVTTIDLPPPVAFAADGGAVWLRPRGHVAASPSELMRVELGSRPRLVATGIEVASPWGVAVLPAGDRIVVAEPSRLSVWDESGRRLLAAGELPRARAQWQELRMVGPDSARLVRLIYSDNGTRLQAWDLEARARRLHPLVDQQLVAPESMPALALSADGSRLLLVSGRGGRGGVSLLDPVTGSSLAQLALPAKRVFVSAAFLPGGGVAVATGHEGRLTLRLFDRQGALLRELPMGSGRFAWLGSPWRATELPFAASMRAPSLLGREWQGELRLLDLASGRVRIPGGRLVPLGGATPWQPGDDRVHVGAPASRLFSEPDGSLVRLDDQGRTHRLLPRPG